MPTITEQTARSGTQSAWNTLYERVVRGATTRAAREFPSNMGSTVRAATNTPTFDPVDYAGEVRGNTYSQEQSPEGIACNPTPAPMRPWTGETYDPEPITPYPGDALGSGSFAEEVRQAGDRFATEDARLREFRRAVREARDGERDSGYSSREYVLRLTNGELVNAAKAYEHLRPELWPFNGSRRFDAPERSEWDRMARAVEFLKLEQWRIDAGYGTPEYEEAYGDLEQKIRRLEFKAIDLNWPRPREQDTEIDPF